MKEEALRTIGQATKKAAYAGRIIKKVRFDDRIKLPWRNDITSNLNEISPQDGETFELGDLFLTIGKAGQYRAIPIHRILEMVLIDG